MHQKRQLFFACYMCDESSGFVPFVAPASPVVAVPQQQAAQQPSLPAWQCIGEALFKNLNTQETVINLPPGIPYFERF